MAASNGRRMVSPVATHEDRRWAQHTVLPTARKVYADQRTPVTQQRVHQLPRVPQKYFCRRDGPQAGPQAPREGPARARRDRGRGGVYFLPSSPTLTLFHRALHTTRHAIPIARGDHVLG